MTPDLEAARKLAERLSKLVYHEEDLEEAAATILALCAALERGKPRVRIVQHGDMNPLVVVDSDEVIRWLRAAADDNGLADREASAVQATFAKAEGDRSDIRYGAPELILMVSNIPGSRSPSPVSGE